MMNEGWSKDLFMEPVKKTLYSATTPEGKKVIVEMGRDKIDQPIKCRAFYGELKPFVASLEIQSREIVLQIESDFRKLGKVDWKPDMDLFLRGFQSIMKDEKERIAEKVGKELEEMLTLEEILVADTPNTFWLIPDESILESMRYLCDTRPDKEERLFFKNFIESQKDCVLMIKVTFKVTVESDMNPID